jgi:hypothetical protein
MERAVTWQIHALLATLESEYAIMTISTANPSSSTTPRTSPDDSHFKEKLRDQ